MAVDDSLNNRNKGWMFCPRGAGAPGLRLKMFFMQGTFSTTILASGDIAGVSGIKGDVTWDGIDIGVPDKKGPTPDDFLLHVSGRFTTTIKNSIRLTIVGRVGGISWTAGLDTMFADENSQKMFFSSGRFSSTILSSFDTGVFFVRSAIVDGCDSMYSTGNAQSDPSKLVHMSGQITSTVKTSLNIASLMTQAVSGIGWDDKNTGAIDNTDKIVLLSGRFSTTIKASISMASGDPPLWPAGDDIDPFGMTPDDVAARVRTITDFDNGQVGQTIHILATASITITDGAPIILNGSADYDMTVTDTLTLTMYNDQVWSEDSRSVN